MPRWSTLKSRHRFDADAASSQRDDFMMLLFWRLMEMCYWLTGIKFVCFFLSSWCVRVSFEGAVQSKTTIVPLIIRGCGEATQVGRCQSSEHRINFQRSIEKHSNTESLLSFWTTCLIVWRNLLICSPCVWADPCVSPFSVFLTISFGLNCLL